MSRRLLTTLVLLLTCPSFFGLSRGDEGAGARGDEGAGARGDEGAGARGDEGAEARTDHPAQTGGWEVVVLTPAQLPELEGVATERLRIFTFRDGFEPVPFQVDEVDARGHYVLPNGPSGRSLEGRFINASELVFLASSLSAKAPPDLPLPCQEGRAVAVAVAREGEKTPLGWVYVAECASETPRATERVIQYLPESDTVEAADYQLGHSKTSPMIPDMMRFFSGGGTGEDFLRGIYVNGEASLLGGVFRITRAENDFRSSLAAWSAGPIRVIRRTPARARTIGDHYTNEGTLVIESILQPGKMTFHVALASSRDLSYFVHDLSMTVAWDFERFQGMQVRVPDVGRVGVVDGVVGPEEQAMAESRAPYIYVSGRQGAVVGGLHFDSRLPVKRSLHYEEPAPDRLRLGFDLSRLQEVSKGRVLFEVFIIDLEGRGYGAAGEAMEKEGKKLRRVKCEE